MVVRFTVFLRIKKLTKVDAAAVAPPIKAPAMALFPDAL